MVAPKYGPGNDEARDAATLPSPNNLTADLENTDGGGSSQSLAGVKGGEGGTADGHEVMKVGDRANAGAGKELTFGAAIDASSFWGQRPVRDYSHITFDRVLPKDDGPAAVAAAVAAAAVATPAIPRTAVGSTGAPQQGLKKGKPGCGDGAGGVAEGVPQDENGDSLGAGKNGDGPNGIALNVWQTPRRRRRRHPCHKNNGAVVKTTFTRKTGEASDVIPPPHPFFAHAAVKKCLDLAHPDGLSGGSSSGGGGCGEFVAVRGTETDGGLTATGAAVGDGGPGCASGLEEEGVKATIDEISQGRVEVGEGGEGGGRGGPAEVVEDKPEDNEGPPPRKQAQDIGWLVAQAMAQPRQGDVWAVLDRRWWLRWQAYTGCGDSECIGEGSESLETPRVAAPHPGQIDNSALVMDVEEPGTVPGSGRRLRRHLARGYHFVLVRRGPALPRGLIPVKDNETGNVVFEPRLYPEFSRLDATLQNVVSDWRELTRILPSSSAAGAAGAGAGGRDKGFIVEGGRAGVGGAGMNAMVPSKPCAACGRAATSKCHACLENSRKVCYCCRECQKAHWGHHKGLCGGSDAETALMMARRGKAGLHNLGNTCFLNSALQCLSHVEPLTQHILTGAFVKDVNPTNPLGSGGQLVQAYQVLLKDLWFDTKNAVSPQRLKAAISQFAPQFVGYGQHDSQEALAALLDGIHEDLNRVLKKPYLVLPDGECGRSDAIIAAESWDMFNMRDRSVLVETVYGQFKGSLECQECGKVSRKFEEFNMMPVQLLGSQRLRLVMDFAPLLAPLRAPRSSNASGNDVTLDAATVLGGGGVEGRRQKRVGLLLRRDALVRDVRDEIAAMFSIRSESVLIVAVPCTGPGVYHTLADSAKILPYSGQDFAITAHEVVPGLHHALVVNHIFEGGRHVSSRGEEVGQEDPLRRWAAEVKAIGNLRSRDCEAPFIISFARDSSCLQLQSTMWMYMRDFMHLSEEEYGGQYVGDQLARSGHIKVSECSADFAPGCTVINREDLMMQERKDTANGVIGTNSGRYIPPLDEVPASAVLDACAGQRAGLDLLRLNWSGHLVQKMNHARISEPYAQDHCSVERTDGLDRSVSLQDCLEKFTAPETLRGGDAWDCGRCNERRPAVKTIKVWSLPEVLILHFKRFSQAGGRKVKLFVDFPINGLDMSPYCRGETLEGGTPMSAMYDLFAVSNHMGEMGEGHYTAFVRDWEGGGMSQEWHVCDDRVCRPIAEAEVKTAHAYVLFYRRRPLV